MAHLERLSVSGEVNCHTGLLTLSSDYFITTFLKSAVRRQVPGIMNRTVPAMAVRWPLSAALLAQALVPTLAPVLVEAVVAVQPLQPELAVAVVSSTSLEYKR